MFKKVLIVIMTLNLIACLSPTPYQSKTDRTKEGYSNRKLSDTRYQIIFQGNEETGRERAHDFARLHAAVTAISNGYHYFSVVKDESTSTYRDASSQRKLSPLRYTKEDGTIIVVEKYQTKFNSGYRSRHSIAMPRVSAIIELHDDNYEKIDSIFNADEIKADISKKYQLNL